MRKFATFLLGLSAEFLADSALGDAHALIKRNKFKSGGKVMRNILLYLLFAVSACFAFEPAQVEIKKIGGGVESKSVAAKEISKGVYRIQIPVRDIPRDTDTIAVRVPVFSAQKGDEGYFVLGDGRLGTFRLDNGRVEEGTKYPMPILGFKKGDTAYLAIVKGLFLEFSAIVEVKDGKYEVFPNFKIKDIEFDPYEDIIVDYYKLEGKDADYVGMGKTYRKYQLDRGVVRPLRERVKNNPYLRHAVDSVYVRVKHGMKKNSKKIAFQTPDNEPPIEIYHDFDDFMKILVGLKNLGCKDLDICSVGCNVSGFDGRYPDIFPIEPAFGGEAKLRKCLDFAHKNGWQTAFHLVYTDAYASAKRFNPADVAKRKDGSMEPYALLAGGQAYSPCFQCVYDRYIDDDFQKFLELGGHCVQHIDVLSAVRPKLCHDPRHPLNRKQMGEYMGRVAAKAQKVFGGLASEGPMDFFAGNLDFTFYVWAWPRYFGKDTPLMDKLVPIWQIAYHGIIMSNPYYATMDYSYPKKIPTTAVHSSAYYAIPDKRDRRLKMAEFGGRPSFYGGIRTENLAPIKEAYDEYQPMKYLQYEFMDDHREIAPKVFRTTYSDGSEVVCNYNETPFVYKGETVGGKDYKLFKPAKDSIKPKAVN